jgi:hypothetical protein
VCESYKKRELRQRLLGLIDKCSLTLDKQISEKDFPVDYCISLTEIVFNLSKSVSELKN